MTVTDKYNDIAIHFDKLEIPDILLEHMQSGPISLADIGCGDGPWFHIFVLKKYISATRPVYAVDIENARLEGIKKRFPWITTIISPADSIPQILDKCLDWVISTNVMEHVPDEGKFLREINRILKFQGKAYISTVYKHRRAWYFRKRNGESVLDTSHLREYTNLDEFKHIITDKGGFTILRLELKPIWFPLLDPLLFYLGKYYSMKNWLLKLLRLVKIPILGYYELHVILTNGNS